MAHGRRGDIINHQSDFESESESSDEDYSPGSLVIDTKRGKQQQTNKQANKHLLNSYQLIHQLILFSVYRTELIACCCL